MAFRTSISILFLFALFAFGEDKKPKPSAAAEVYKSPEAVFAASVTASEKHDAVKAINCIAPTAHAEMAAYLAFNAMTARKFSAKQPKVFAPVIAVLNKHGLTEKATKDINTSNQKAAIKELIPLIKKPTEFAIEMSAAQHQFAAKMNTAKKPKITQKLTDVKIDGGKAKGLIVITVGDKMFEQPMEFVKVGEGWKMRPDFISQSMNLRPKK